MQKIGVETEPRYRYRASVAVQSLGTGTEPRYRYRASVPVQSLGTGTEPRYRTRSSRASCTAFIEPSCHYYSCKKTDNDSENHNARNKSVHVFAL